MYVVYQLVNSKNEIEYIGHTKNPDTRLRNHTCVNGKFVGRTDLILQIVKSGFRKRYRAFEYECKLQKKLGFQSDREKYISLGKSIQKMGTDCRKVKIAAYKTTGEFLGIFPTIKDAANNFNLHTNLVWLVANNKQKSTKGYIFKSLENL
jgi:predicted GIY-YIG superfamily endonuclease